MQYPADTQKLLAPLQCVAPAILIQDGTRELFPSPLKFLKTVLLGDEVLVWAAEHVPLEGLQEHPSVLLATPSIFRLDNVALIT